MKLPEAEVAEISEHKIVGYRLSSAHQMGKSEAAFFGKHGFAVINWKALAQAQRAHATTNPIAQTMETLYGTRYVVDGPLVAPDGTALNMRSVWFIRRATTVPGSQPPIR